MNTTPEQARNQAKRDFAKGYGHKENPYTRGTPEHDAYMLQMGKLQYDEFVNEQHELRAGV